MILGLGFVRLRCFFVLFGLGYTCFGVLFVFVLAVFVCVCF